MLCFTPASLSFLVFGIVFVSFAFLFVLPRAKRNPLVVLCAVLFANFGGFFILLGFWDILSWARLVTQIAALSLGISLVPIGFQILAGLLGESGRSKGWLLPVVFATLAVWAICSAMYVFGIQNPRPMTICYGYCFAAYLAMLGVEAYRLRPLKRLPGELAFFLGFLGLCVLMLGVMAVFQTLRFDSGKAAVWVLLAVLFCFTAGTVYRRPDAFLRIEAQSKAVRSSRTFLANVDAHAKLKEIDLLMEEEELYRDAELSLERLAERTALSPHQLSELLNVYAQRTFSEFIAQRRVERAKVELAEARAPILEIAFSCGFNAKSTFNETFRKATGLTPTAYRNARRDAQSPAPKKA